jgi:hypothetical protein
LSDRAFAVDHVTVAPARDRGRSIPDCTLYQEAITVSAWAGAAALAAVAIVAVANSRSAKKNRA